MPSNKQGMRGVALLSAVRVLLATERYILNMKAKVKGYFRHGVGNYLARGPIMGDLRCCHSMHLRHIGIYIPAQ